MHWHNSHKANYREHRNITESVRHLVNSHKTNTYRKHNKNELLQVTASKKNIVIVEVDILRY